MANKTFLVEDSSFLVSVLQSTDRFHNEAVFTLKKLLLCDVVYVYSEVVLNETIFTLMKGGYDSDLVRTRINRLSMLDKVIINNTDALSTLRYASRLYNHLTMGRSYNITKTNDFIIACTAIDYEGIVIGNDKQMLKTLKSLGIDCCNYTNETEVHELVERLT